MLSFLIGAFMVIVGMAMFTIGADVSMTQIGSHIGGALTRSRRLRLIVILSFLLGMMITVSEPDLQILAKNVPSIDGTVLIVTVAAGVGIFLVISMLRIFFSISLKWLFIVSGATGTDTDAGAFCFSLPISEVAGLRKFDMEKE